MVKKELLDLTDRFKEQEAEAEMAQKAIVERGRADVDSAATELEVLFFEATNKVFASKSSSVDA